MCQGSCGGSAQFCAVIQLRKSWADLIESVSLKEQRCVAGVYIVIIIIYWGTSLCGNGQTHQITTAPKTQKVVSRAHTVHTNAHTHTKYCDCSKCQIPFLLTEMQKSCIHKMTVSCHSNIYIITSSLHFVSRSGFTPGLIIFCFVF